MLAVVTLLIFDAARSRRQAARGGPAAIASIAAPASSRRHGPRRLLVTPAWLAAGALYCVVVGSFRRYTWPAVLAAGIILQVIAVRRPARLPSLGRVLSHVMRSRTGRVGVVVAWTWVGLHCFAR
jgi:hypothetical protein